MAAGLTILLGAAKRTVAALRGGKPRAHIALAGVGGERLALGTRFRIYPLLALAVVTSNALALSYAPWGQRGESTPFIGLYKHIAIDWGNGTGRALRLLPEAGHDLRTGA